MRHKRTSLGVSSVRDDAMRLLECYGPLLSAPRPTMSMTQEDVAAAIETARLRLCGDRQACGQMGLDFQDTEL